MLWLLAACGEVPCVELDAACAPLYEPTWENVHGNTVGPSCGQGVGCHSAEGAQSGLVFEDIDGAYEAMVGGGLVIPGEPACSEAMFRVTTREAGEAMPPGRPLSDAEACAIQQWIAAGAER